MVLAHHAEPGFAGSVELERSLTEGRGLPYIRVINIEDRDPRFKALSSKEPTMIYVTDYTRIRFGRLEHVRAHWRSSPV